MTVQEEYKNKCNSIQETAKLINAKDVVYIGGSCSAPYTLIDTIVDRAEEVKGLRIIGMLLLHPTKMVTTPGLGDKITYESIFYGGVDRIGMKNGVTKVNPIQFSKSAYALQHVIGVNTLMVTTAGMDENGYFDYGPTGSWNGLVQPYCDKVILCVNKQMPRSRGEYTKLHISEVDYICEIDEPLAELPQPEVTDNDRAIADIIVPMIPDGSCIQIGLGGLANAIGYGLEQKKNLSVHTEMITDSIVHLAKIGVINGKIYGGFCLGNTETYNYSAESDNIELAPIPIVNQAPAIGANDNFISINSCLEVDLTGQVCSEGMGFTQYSSTGGQLDFVRGAALSKGGKSFMCMASTYTDKKGNLQSKIVLSFSPGSVVTTPRTDTMYVVTEHGIADVYCKNIPDRVAAMIAVAHPDFRESLHKQAVEAGLIFA